MGKEKGEKSIHLEQVTPLGYTRILPSRRRGCPGVGLAVGRLSSFAAAWVGEDGCDRLGGPGGVPVVVTWVTSNELRRRTGGLDDTDGDLVFR